MNARYNNHISGKHKLAHKLKSQGVRVGQANDLSLIEGGFKCVHCRQYVSLDDLLSGVANRNHCPYCLWSRHLDLKKAGDRLSACKGGMQPVGLALKRSRNKYVSQTSGELMIIHRCSECGKLSLNRIAADDNPDDVLEILEISTHSGSEIQRELETSGITPLRAADFPLVRRQLFGWKGRREEMPWTTGV